MFNKVSPAKYCMRFPADEQDDASMSPAVGTLKKLAVLEPDLIMPATIERAIPSLQGLEEVSRRMTFCQSRTHR
jgi:hypothetical protein